MNQAASQPYRQTLRALMTQAGIGSLEELSRRSQVSTWHLYRIQSGLMAKVALENAVKVANALQISVDELLKQFCPGDLSLPLSSSSDNFSTHSAEIARLKQEYDRLAQQFAQQQELLTAEFQQTSLETIESWLLQWPTAAAAAEKNPQLPAVKLINLVKPISDLLRRWGVETLGVIGETVAYDPQVHQLMEGEAERGDRVWVRYVGYQQEEKLLYRAKVSPILDDYPETQAAEAYYYD